MKKLIGILLIFLSLQAFACDCIILADYKSYLPLVDFVFTGKVIELIKVETEDIEMPSFFDSSPKGREQWAAMNPDQFYARVEMIDYIKGDLVRSDTMFFVSEFTNCDPEYELNESYLFFANKTKNEQFAMAHCTPWGKLEDSEQTIETLKK